MNSPDTGRILMYSLEAPQLLDAGQVRIAERYLEDRDRQQTRFILHEVPKAKVNSTVASMPDPFRYSGTQPRR